jgi:hypothetical protein
MAVADDVRARREAVVREHVAKTGRLVCEHFHYGRGSVQAAGIPPATS